MQEALLYEHISESRIRCNTCQWRCKLNPDKYGACGAYQNKDGKLYNLIYGIVSSLAADPIEKKPLFHFHPGTAVFSMGTLGCNLHCKHCQNWQISRVDTRTAARECMVVSPETAVEQTVKNGCQGIAWTYNEPGIWLEYVRDTAVLAKDRGLYTVFVTNGYSTPEALDTVAPYLDAYRVDIKGFSDSFYKDITGVPRWR